MNNLSNLKISQAKPSVSAYKLNDGDGLILQINPNGGKFWRVRFTHNGKEKTLSVGAYPDISLAQARELRNDARKLLAKGIDPSAHKQATKAQKKLSEANTFGAIVKAWHTHWQAGKAAHYAKQTLAFADNHLQPLYALPIKDITAPKIKAVMKALAANNSLLLARQAHQIIGMVFRYAIANDFVDRNPAADFKPSDIVQPHKNTNHARITIAELPELLSAIENSGKDFQTKIALKLLNLTLVRIGELTGARWCEFDIDNAVWTIPAERMKKKTPHIVPLSRQALELLNQLEKRGDYLFANQKNVTQPMPNKTPLSLIHAIGYKGRMTLHGFRGLASTQLHEMGFDETHIETQLAHLTGNATSRAYNHAKHLPDRTKMLQTWADFVDGARHGNVIAIGKAA